MGNDEIFDILKGIINSATEKLEEEIESGTKLIEDLHLDSLEIVDILMDIEDRLMITMSETDLEKISTVGDAVDKIAALL